VPQCPPGPIPLRGETKTKGYGTAASSGANEGKARTEEGGSLKKTSSKAERVITCMNVIKEKSRNEKGNCRGEWQLEGMDRPERRPERDHPPKADERSTLEDKLGKKRNFKKKKNPPKKTPAK